MEAEDKSRCPDESQILAFCEGTLLGGKRKNLEKHFSECDSCRISLALLTKAASDKPDQISSGELDRQRSRVMRMLEQDHQGDRQIHRTPLEVPVHRRAFVWAGVAATVALAIGGPLFYRAYIDDSVIHQSMAALKVALVQGRRSQVRISGGLPYSQYHATRSDSSDDSMELDRAEHILNGKGGTISSPEAIHMLCRVQLLRLNGDDAEQALKSLQELETKRGLSPELANDIGAALYNSRDAKSAIRYFTIALNRRPGYPEALFNRALAEEQLSLYRDAEDDWREYTHVAPQNDDWLGEAQGHLHDVEQHESNQNK